MVGVDGSDASLRAAAYAVGIARRERAKLVGVYVRRVTAGVPFVAEQMMDGLVAAYEAQDETEAYLHEAFTYYTRTWGVAAHLVVRTGDPLVVLTGIADRVLADAVVVGTSTSLRYRGAGSLGMRLVRCSRWPVTIVP